MWDGNSETETELQAAERRISKLQRCGAARVASMEQSFLGLLEAIGEDPQREGLVRTPGRAARAFEFLTAGYRQSLDGIINNALFESEASEIILVKDIELYSLCEHHLLPFIGKAHVAYIPNGKVVGLSKTARIVDMINIYPAATDTDIWSQVEGKWPRERMMSAAQVADAVKFALARPTDTLVENITLSSLVGNL